MKTQMDLPMNLKKKLSVAFSALFLIALSSCGKIPSGYQGTFVDQPSGAKLTLSSSDGTFSEAGGRQITAQADSLQFEALTQAKAGLYTRPVAGNDKMLELFWVIPDAASRQEGAGLVWFSSEILYTRLATEAKDPVASLQVEHCKNGMLMLDIPSQTWNGGCGADTVPMLLTRVAGK
jgi:hypothetical protein